MPGYSVGTGSEECGKAELPGTESSRYKDTVLNRTELWGSTTPLEMQGVQSLRGESARTELP